MKPATTIRAIYENGVFRPLGKVDLPEHAEVEVRAAGHEAESGQKNAQPDPVSAARQRVWDILARCRVVGPPDLAEKHNEHQP